MSKLVDLNEFRMGQACKRGFAQWQKRFGEAFTLESGFEDLQNSTIGTLAEPGDNSTFIFNELIMGVLDLGNVMKFEYLNPADRLKIIDIQLFLADLVRFEMMHRLKWIDDFPNRECSLIELILTYDDSDYSQFTNPPLLSKSHPKIDEYDSKIPREKVVMVRQLFPEALIAFKEHFK
jgi:hypothetical protein